MAAYTSSDEFDLERRVWMTNEIPPYDMYKALNSAMQEPFWKWLLGTSKVEYNLPYRIYSEQKNSYVHDENSDEVYLKMTNGQISKNYGPTVSNDPSKNNYNPTYNRIEIDGVILPEFDLMLHEVYRYLATLYPDHPDENKLLTENEFNDTILAAGDMIDYTPDIKFFNKVAENLSRGLSNNDILDEASKIKIRNLLNNSFRRKLYGSKAGYRMFANDIFQICTIFPVATYLPIKPVDPNLIQRENNTLNNQSALDAFNMTKKEYQNYTRQYHRDIDTYSKLYYRKFRLVDWDGKNSSYLQKEDKNTYIFGYSIPCNENRIYEFPNTDDNNALLDNINAGSVVENSEDVKGITYINEVSNGIFETILSGSLDENNVMNCSSKESATNEIHYISTSHNNAIKYQTGYLYNGVETILNAVKNCNNNNLINDYFAQVSGDYNNHYKNPKGSSMSFFDFLFSRLNSKISLYTDEVESILNIIKPTSCKVMLNPYIGGTLLLEPSKSISYYPNDIPNFSLSKDALGNPTGDIEVEEDKLIDSLHLFNKYIGNKNLVADSRARTSYLYIINNFTKGSISYTLDSTSVATVEEIPVLPKDNRYCIVVTTANNDKVVLVGNIKVNYITDGALYKPDTILFNITNIPETKSDALMKVVYSDYNNLKNAIDIINDECASYNYVGMTEEGCQDIIKIMNVQPLDVPVVTSIDGIEESTFGKILQDNTDQYYFKTTNGNVIKFGENINTSPEAVLAYYKSASGHDYSKYIELYLEKQTYLDAINSYSLNRSLLYENSTFTADTTLDEDEWTTFERSTIRPGCVVNKILQISGSPLKPVFGTTAYNSGIIDEYSLGYLSVLPVVNDGYDAFSIGSVNADTDIMTYDENKCSSYDYKNITIHWPHMAYFSPEKCPHPTLIVSTSSGDEVRTNYNASSYSEIDINRDSRTDSAASWFANAESNPDGIIKNITIKPISTNPVKIESVIDISNENLTRTITFKSDIAKKYYKTLSVGDTVFGPTIDSDNATVYITSIGYNSVTVNRDFTQSGTFIFTYNCKMDINGTDEEEDMSAYRANLDKYDTYSIVNPFDHGLWGSRDFPYASNAILESLPDISFYKPYNYKVDVDNTTISSFNEVMNEIHPKRYTGDNFVRMPSTIKFMNDLFVELNITKTIPATTRTGKSNILMSVDWLDYITNSLKDISRATDKANVGVNLMMETDSTGYYTLSPNLTYTDPNVQLKFITLNFKGIQPMWHNYPISSHGQNGDWTVPAYAQIGTGGSGRFNWFTSPADVSYPNIWGNNIYDSEAISKDDLEVLNENNGKIRKRSTWGNNDVIEQESIEGNSRFRSVEKPLFEIPLGEYDVQTRYLPSSSEDLNRACTTIQSSFYAQTFNKLTKYMGSDTSSGSGDVENMPIVLNNKNFLEKEPIAYFNGIQPLEQKKDWIPTTTKYKGINIINLPSISNSEYCIIPEDVTLSNVAVNNNGEFIDKAYIDETDRNGATISFKDITYKNHSIYIRNNNISYLYEPIFGGYIDKTTLYRTSSDNKNIITELVYATLKYQFKIDSDFTNHISKLTDISNRNKIFWYIIGDINERDATSEEENYTFTEKNIKKNSIVGLITPNKTTSNISDFGYAIFNRGYYTSTLPIVRPIDIPDTNYNKSIGNIKNNISSLTIQEFCNLDTKTEYLNNSGNTINLIETNQYILRNQSTFTVVDSLPDGISTDKYIEALTQAGIAALSEGYTKYVGATKKIAPGDSIYIDSPTAKPVISYSSSPVYNIIRGVTEITLPRRCITEGSYNFDYIIDAGITCTGYLYGTSTPNEVVYDKAEGDVNEYDTIENDNFDIITNDEVTFNATRAAIYKDDINNEFYTYTNEYKDASGISHNSFDKLKKVAIKFEEQKYFKNTTYLTGMYKNVISQASGSNEIIETPTLRQINDVGEFNTNLISSNDSIIRITPMDLRSIYNQYLEPVLYSNYYSVDGMVRGIDKDGNLVISYDNTVSGIANNTEKLLYGSKLRSIIPVTKVFDDETQSFNTVFPEESYFEFTGDNAYPAPVINTSSVKFTKSIISDNRIVGNNAYEFKYFKNLLILHGAIANNKPDTLVPTKNDTNQFNNATRFLRKGDTPIESFVLSSSADAINMPLAIAFTDSEAGAQEVVIDNLDKAYYDAASKSFICVSGKKVGYAQPVDLPTEKKVSLNYFSEVYQITSNGFESLSDDYKIKNVTSDDDDWILTIEEKGTTNVYSFPHDYEASTGKIEVRTAYSAFSKVDSIVDTILLPNTEQIKTTKDGVLTYSNAYAKWEDVSVSSASEGGEYEIKPFAINYKDDGLEGRSDKKFFFSDPNSKYAVFGCGRDAFIKSPVYLSTKDGEYTEQVSQDTYWKYACLPLLNDTSYAKYERIKQTTGEHGVYMSIRTLRDSILDIYKEMANLPKYIKRDSNNKWTFYDGENSSTIIEGDTLPGEGQSKNKDVIVMLSALGKAFGSNGDSSLNPTLADIMEKYYPYYQILTNLHPMPWRDEDGITGIESFIAKISKEEGNKFYYYWNTNNFTITSVKPTISTDDPSTYKEYLEGSYNKEGGYAEIIYYGVGPYERMTVNKAQSETPIDRIYGANLTFDGSCQKQYRSDNNYDSSWYVDYANNFATYGMLEDDISQVFDGDITNVIFTKNNIIFTSSGGSIIYIDKKHTYKVSDLENINNWHTSDIPKGLSYDYIDRTNVLHKTIKYKADSVFKLPVQYLNRFQPIYTISSTYVNEDIIILCGAIQSRESIESDWNTRYSLDKESDREYGLYLLSKCVPLARFYYSTTPLILYSTNGGKTFSISNIPNSLPYYSINATSPVTLKTATRIVGDAILLDDATSKVIVTQNGTEKASMSTYIKSSTDEKKLDLTVYDAIDVNGILDDNQDGGLKVMGVTYVSPDTYKFYLQKSKDSADYDYILETKLDKYNDTDFENLNYKDFENDVKKLSTAYSVNYNNFVLYVNPSMSSIGIISRGTVNTLAKVDAVSPDGITMDTDLIASGTDGARTEVVIAFETMSSLSISDQKSCINQEFLSNYFDEYHNCYVKHIKITENAASADGVFNYRETLENLKNNDEGYPAVVEDTNHKFYEYNDPTTVKNDNGETETKYIPKNITNADGQAIYLCNVDGEYINKSNKVIQPLSFYEIIYSDLGTDIMYAAPKPIYESVDKAKQDSSLREEDESWKSLFNVKYIKAINQDYETVPYSYMVEDPEELGVLRKGNFIIKKGNSISVSSESPADIQIGADISSFDLNEITCAGPAYMQYKPTGATVQTDNYIYKTNTGLIQSMPDSPGTEAKLLGYLNSVGITNLISMPCNSYFIYVGEKIDIIPENAYITNNGNGKYEVVTTEPKSGLNLTDDVTQPNDAIDLRNIINYVKLYYQRKYTGADKKIAKNSYIARINGKLKSYADFIYDNIGDRSNINDIINIPENSYSKYTGENYPVKTNSYILHSGKTFTLSEKAPLAEQSSLSSLDDENIQRIYDLPDETYIQYIGATKVIDSSYYLTNVNGTHYLSTVNPNSLIQNSTLSSTDNISTIIEKVNTLKDREYLSIQGDNTELIDKNDYIIHTISGNYEVRKNPITDKTKAKDTISDIALTDSALVNNSYIPYEIQEDRTLSKNDFIYNKDDNLVILSRSSIPSENVSTITLDKIATMNEGSMVIYTGANSTTLLKGGSYIYKVNDTINISSTSLKLECTPTFNQIKTLVDNECIKVTESAVLQDAKKWLVYVAGTGYTSYATLTSSFQSTINKSSITLKDLIGLAANGYFINISNNTITVIAKNNYITSDGKGNISVSTTAPAVTDDSPLGSPISTLKQDTIKGLKAGSYLYTGSTLSIKPGQRVELTSSKTYNVKNDRNLSSPSLDTIMAMSNNQFYYCEAGFSLTKDTCIIYQNKKYTVANDSIYVKYNKGPEINTPTGLIGLANNTWYKYTGTSLTFNKNSYILRYNNILYKDVEKVTTKDNIIGSLSTANTCMEYTGETFTIAKNGYLINTNNKKYIVDNPIYNMKSVGELTSLDFATINSIANNTTENKYFTYTGEKVTLSSSIEFCNHRGTIFYGTEDDVKLPESNKTNSLDFNKPLDNNSYINIKVAMSIPHNGYYIKSNNVISYSHQNQLKSSDDIKEFTLANLYSMAEDTYAKYTGVNYTILKNSYFIRTEDKAQSKIEANFPVENKGSINSLDLNILANMSNYQVKATENIEIKNDTFYRNVDGKISSAESSSSTYHYMDVDTFDLNKFLNTPTSWYRQYIGPDLYINASDIISRSPSEVDEANISTSGDIIGILEAILSNPTVTYKFMPDNNKGIIIKSNSYFVYNDNHLSISENLPSNMLRLNDIVAEDTTSFISSFIAVSYNDYHIKYVGKDGGISKNSYIYKENGEYKVESNVSYTPSNEELHIEGDLTENKVETILNNLVKIPENTCTKCIDNNVSLPAGIYYIYYLEGSFHISISQPSSMDEESANDDKLRSISSLVSNPETKYIKLDLTANNILINKDEFVTKSNGYLKVTSNAPQLYGYTETSIDKIDFDQLYKMQSNIIYKYTGENYTLKENTYIIKSNNTISTADKVITRQTPISGDILNTLEKLTTLDDNTEVQYTGQTVSINKNSYIVRLDGKFAILNKEFKKLDNFATFDLRDLDSIEEGTYRQYTGEEYVFKTNSYILNNHGDWLISDNARLDVIADFDIKVLSEFVNDKYFKYMGPDICLADIGITLSESLSISDDKLSEYFYLEDEDQERLNIETEYLDSVSSAVEQISLSFDDRFVLKKIGNSSNRFYYDRILGYFPLKAVRYIEFNAKFGYSINQAVKNFFNQNLHDIDTLDSGIPAPITHIYLQQRGYGGTRLRTEKDNSWKEELPWEIDKVAFMDKHLKNSNNEPILLCDSIGKEIISNHGEFIVHNNDIVKVSVNDLAENTSKTLSLLSFENNTIRTLATVKVSKPALSKNLIWTSQNNVSIDITQRTGTTQELTNIYYICPDKFMKSELSADTSIMVSTIEDIVEITDSDRKDGETYEAAFNRVNKFDADENSDENSDEVFAKNFAKNFKIEGGVLKFTMPGSLERYPKWIKITSKGITKIISISYDKNPNNVYGTVTPAYYYYYNDEYVFVKNTNNNMASYTLGSNTVTLNNSEKISLTDTDSAREVNLPLFELGKLNAYYLYDMSYERTGVDSTNPLYHVRSNYYIGSRKIEDTYISEEPDDSKSEESISISASYSDNTYTFEFGEFTIEKHTESSSGLALDSETFIVSNENEIKFKVIADPANENELYIKGALGPIYMRYPRYQSFESLLREEGPVIKEYDDYFNASTVKGGNEEPISDAFNLIETNGVTLSKKLPIDSLNDGKTHFVRIEVLTRKTVPLTKNNAFNDDYEEIPLKDISIFPPDRVYFNPKGYPKSPIIINNTLFRGENNIYYSSALFTNANDNYIRECNKSGKLIRYIVSNGDIIDRPIDSSKDSIDDTFIPRYPNYNSCKEWFENEFYIKGQESNPFWQVINLTSKFNTVTQSWNQELTLNKFEKMNRTIKQTPVSNDEAYLKLSRASTAEIIDDEIRQDYNCNYLDLFEGKIRFIASEPDNTLYSEGGAAEIIKYGICANNTVKDTFHPNDGEEIKIPGYLQSSYTVNSKKNFANPNEADSAIVEVTELGIFNRYHILIAYAVFPPIEYRSDTQHVSFTSFVKYGSCSIE